MKTQRRGSPRPAAPKRRRRPPTAIGLVLLLVVSVEPVFAQGACRTQLERRSRTTDEASDTAAETLVEIYRRSGWSALEPEADEEPGPQLERFCRELGLDHEPAGVATRVQLAVRELGEITAAEPSWSDLIRRPDFVQWALHQVAAASYPWANGESSASTPVLALLLPRYQAWSALGDRPHRLTPQALDRLKAPSPDSGYTVAARFIADQVGPVPGLADLPYGPERLQRTVELLLEAPSARSRRERALLRLALVTPQARSQVMLAMVNGVLRDEGATFRAGLDDLELVGFEMGSAPELVSDAALARLGGSSVMDVTFPTRTLLAKALRIEAGIGPDSPLYWKILDVAAEDAGSWEPRPIELENVGCGCGSDVKNRDETPVHLYGMYPAWSAPQGRQASPDSVDFSVLTRIGYHGVAIREDGTLGDPGHWRQGPAGDPGWFARLWAPDFNDFVKDAHRFKTAVDLVVYRSEWGSWVDDPGSADERLGRLEDAIVGEITPTLTGLRQRLKPWIGLGQSPRQTLGDGVTLDLDFSGLSTIEQARLSDAFGRFFRSLRGRLNFIARPGGWIKGRPEYFVNIVVPHHCFDGRTPCGIYSRERVAGLARDSLVDLVLVDLTQSNVDRTGTEGYRVSEADALERVHSVRAGLDDLEDAEARRALQERLVPLVALDQAVPPTDLMAEADWNFSGLGFWGLPHEAAFADSLKAAFADGNSTVSGTGVFDLAVRLTGPVVGLTGWVCSWACPWRWAVRTLVVIPTALLVGFWMVVAFFGLFRATWDHPWSRSIRLVALVSLPPLMLVSLWCDPYWSERKPTILLLGVFSFGLVVFGRVYRGARGSRGPRQ